MIVFTMFFDAGIVSNFMVVLSLGIKNTMWAIVLPPRSTFGT
jgi:putative aldouronate transport system permease protein